jgi:hypothetical protein
LLNNHQFTIPIPNGRTLTISNPSDWTQYIVSVNELEQLTGYNFFSEVPELIRNQLKQQRNNTGILRASLLTEDRSEFPAGDNNWLNLIALPVSDESTIRESQVPVAIRNILPLESRCSSEIDIHHIEPVLSSFQVGIPQVSGSYSNIAQVRIPKTDLFHIAIPDGAFVYSDSIQVSSSQVGVQKSFDGRVLKIGFDQNGCLTQRTTRRTDVPEF